MQRILPFLLLVLLLNDCSSQPPVESKLVSKQPIYKKGCKIRVPDFYWSNQYFSFTDNDMFIFKQLDSCGIKINNKKMQLPNYDLNEYKILNDSLAVFTFQNFFNLLFYCDYRTGNLLKVDTVRISSEIDGSSEDDFTGGVFAFDNLYFSVARWSGRRKNVLFRTQLFSNKTDTLQTEFSMENYLQTVKSSDNFLVAFSGATFNVFQLSANRYYTIAPQGTAKSTLKHEAFETRLGSDYVLLDFINDQVVLLHHSKIPYEFAVLNISNGKSLKFELDKNIFAVDKIRPEEILNVEDGPSDGLNKQPFLYLSCKIKKNNLIISFADRNENRLFYSLTFTDAIMAKLR